MFGKPLANLHFSFSCEIKKFPFISYDNTSKKIPLNFKALAGPHQEYRSMNSNVFSPTAFWTMFNNEDPNKVDSRLSHDSLKIQNNSFNIMNNQIYQPKSLSIGKHSHANLSIPFESSSQANVFSAMQNKNFPQFSSSNSQQLLSKDQNECLQSPSTKSLSEPPQNLHFPRSSTIKKSRRRRTAFTASQLTSLERNFSGRKYLAVADRADLATILGLSETQIKYFLIFYMVFIGKYCSIFPFFKALSEEFNNFLNNFYF